MLHELKRAASDVTTEVSISEIMEKANGKRAIIWSALFAAELLAVLFRMNISRYYSDLTARLVFGSLLAAVGGIGLLLEVFKIGK